MNLVQGDIFPIFKAFYQAITSYEKATGILFVTYGSEKNRDSATNTEFPYQSIRCRCKQGKIRPSDSKGMRVNQSSFKQGCAASLRVQLQREAGPSEKRLLKYLFSPKREDAHNILERPNSNESSSLEVYLKLFLTQIIDVDEKNQILQTNVWMDLKWYDYHFHWDPLLFNNISQIIVPPSRVWKPDILLYNSADERFDATFPVNVVIGHDKLMHYVPPGMLKSTCNISIKWYPFDTQTCSLKFGSWTHEGNLVDLMFYCDNMTNCNQKNGKGDTGDLLENGEWDVISFNAERHVTTYQCCPMKYIDITYYLQIKRRTLYYTFNLIVPCIIISTMALLGFLIPPDAGEKISLGVTILLSLTVFLMMVAEKMPPTSAAIPLIGIYFTCVMIICSLSLVFTVLVLNFHHRSSDAIEIPYWLKLMVNVWLARLLFMKPRNRISAETGSGLDNLNRSSIPGASPSRSASNAFACKRNSAMCNRAFQSGSVKGSKSLLANVLDMENEIWARAAANMSPSPTLLNSGVGAGGNEIIFGIGGGGGGGGGSTGGAGGGVSIMSVPSYEQAINSQMGNNTNIPSASAGGAPTATGGGEQKSRSQVREILAHLRRVTQKLAETELAEIRANEWKFAARVMDRFCLLIFSIVIIISSTTILMQDVLNSRPTTNIATKDQ